MLHFLSGKTGKKRKCNYNEDAVAALIIFIAKVICIGIPVPISLSLLLSRPFLTSAAPPPAPTRSCGALKNGSKFGWNDEHFGTVSFLFFLFFYRLFCLIESPFDQVNQKFAKHAPFFYGNFIAINHGSDNKVRPWITAPVTNHQRLKRALESNWWRQWGWNDDRRADGRVRTVGRRNRNDNSRPDSHVTAWVSQIRSIWVVANDQKSIHTRRQCHHFRLFNVLLLLP